MILSKFEWEEMGSAFKVIRDKFTDYSTTFYKTHTKKECFKLISLMRKFEQVRSDTENMCAEELKEDFTTHIFYGS